MNDHEAVAKTALDYFEGWYEADPVRIDRTLHSGLVKRRPLQVDDGLLTTKQRMLELVGEGGGTSDRTDDPIDVEVVDLHHDIASVVVRSAQYREYLHLMRTTEGWRIVNAFFQLTQPEEPSS